eukprot:CAMPEP_0179292966 /NCGR_PEP_ID=MMETSP0797-20121207/43129_1 /TAXON_ID=47934 /ORGANISM="Dinophysis acuminata, Strain DAEP01" /LENGTH=295 /DNA_ID=CAMNT_0021002097 /DNA_START=37 /DNA_END=921 /DNA_ORIENTATION=-
MEGMLPLRIGLIADIQHADLPDGQSDYGLVRHYRDAVNKARMAAKDWTTQKCAFAVNLGDTVDRRGGQGASGALDSVLEAFGGFAPVIHIPGNHDLSALTEADLGKLRPGAAAPQPHVARGPSSACEVCPPGSGWRVLVLDTYDVAVRRDEELARATLGRLLEDARRSGKSAPYLTQHSELNGAVGEEQLEWLHGRLQAASDARDRVVVLSHAPLRPDVTIYRDAVCWNWEQVNDLLESYPSTVAAVITGHDHHVGEVVSKRGIYHRVLEAAMEGAVGTPTHAVLELSGTRISLQ